MVYGPATTAVSLLVLRIVGFKSTSKLTIKSTLSKRLIYCTLALVWIMAIICCILTYAQCDPPRALWEPEIPHNCWDPLVQSRFAIATRSECQLSTYVILNCQFKCLTTCEQVQMSLQTAFLLLNQDFSYIVCGSTSKSGLVSAVSWD